MKNYKEPRNRATYVNVHAEVALQTSGEWEKNIQ